MNLFLFQVLPGRHLAARAVHALHLQAAGAARGGAQLGRGGLHAAAARPPAGLGHQDAARRPAVPHTAGRTQLLLVIMVHLL